MAEEGVYIRAKGKDGKWKSMDIMEVDAKQFLEWVKLKLKQFQERVSSWDENPKWDEDPEKTEQRRVKFVFRDDLNNPRAWIIHCLEGFNIAKIYRVKEEESDKNE